MKKTTAAKTASTAQAHPSLGRARRALTVRPDTVDFRDLMYVPTLVEVPSERPLPEFLETHPLILDQGQEGACTGFGLAAVANHLLRTRKVKPDPPAGQRPHVLRNGQAL